MCLICIISKVLYMSSSFRLMGVESHDFSLAEKKITACKGEQIHKMRQLFSLKMVLKYYSPTVTHGKTFVLDFWYKTKVLPYAAVGE